MKIGRSRSAPAITSEGTRGARTCRAAWFARVDVTTIASARRISEIRKCGTVRRVIHIHAVAESAIDCWVVAGERSCEHAADDEPQRDVGDIVEYTTPVGKSRGVAAEQSETARRVIRRSANPGVETKQIRNRAGLCSWRC